MAIAGIDIGTTGCKCTIYNREGHFLGEAYKEYPTEQTDKHTLDAEMVWSYTKDVLREAALQIQVPLEAIGVTSFGEAAIWLNHQMEPMAPSLLYTHPDGQEQCDRLTNHFGKAYITRTTGLNPNPMYSVSKLMYSREQRPGQATECQGICCFGDFIVYMLSGVQQMDYSLASRTMAFDINHLKWDEAILEYAGIDKAWMPNPVQIGTIAGKIRSSVAEELGIGRNIIIVSGCHDQIAASIGTGAYQPGMAVEGVQRQSC
ncbi:hypothetical protein JI735_33265 [Paenibacillus sonchi]|uniref:Carbohydrate kinase FGGY N-terminal domain-containing protein n=1 Tax=Paenibacillus sonchi TaxID=373687 RepID=A0A974PCD2_9BACL|nr:FGGY family carbohydrate kinase [Paenibacillus sonchi]QQZ61186.1 hypothetical protein JI735_33265 [Paenibacillus sonchi]